MNIIKFENILREKNVTKDDIAKVLGKDRATVYRRLAKNGEAFTVADVSKLATFLKLSLEEANSIFFAD